MNKKGFSTGFTWVFGLVTIFGLGLLYIVFNQVLTASLVPTIKNMVNATGPLEIPQATQDEINSGIDKYMDFFHIMPFILFFVVVIYMFVAAIRKERESQFV
jgi:hypothetical protein